MQQPGTLNNLGSTRKHGFTIAGCLPLNLHQRTGINRYFDRMLQTVSEIIIQVVADKTA